MALKRNGLGHPENMRVSRVFLHTDGTLLAMICAKRPAQRKPLISEGVGLYRSIDGAETWRKVKMSKLFLYPKDFTVHPRDSKRILVGTCDANWEDKSGGLYQSENGGAPGNASHARVARPSAAIFIQNTPAGFT